MPMGTKSTKRDFADFNYNGIGTEDYLPGAVSGAAWGCGLKRAAF